MAARVLEVAVAEGAGLGGPDLAEDLGFVSLGLGLRRLLMPPD